MSIAGAVLAVVAVITYFAAGGAWWAVPFVLAGIASLTGWNAALRAKGEIALGADYRWNSRIQLGYTLGRVVGYLFFAVVIILLLVAVTLMLMGQLKL